MQSITIYDGQEEFGTVATVQTEQYKTFHGNFERELKKSLKAFVKLPGKCAIEDFVQFHNENCKIKIYSLHHYSIWHEGN